LGALKLSKNKISIFKVSLGNLNNGLTGFLKALKTAQGRKDG